jgi:hypothetical protein
LGGGCQILGKGVCIIEPLERADELKFACGKSVAELLQEQPAEESREHAHGQEESL